MDREVLKVGAGAGLGAGAMAADFEDTPLTYDDPVSRQ